MPNNEGKPVVLVAEDDEGCARLYRMWVERELTGKAQVEFLMARTIGDMLRFLEARRNEIDLIFCDNRLIGGETLEVIRELRNSGYPGVMIACSGAPGMPEKQIEAGCDCAIDSEERSACIRAAMVKSQ